MADNNYCNLFSSVHSFDCGWKHSRPFSVHRRQKHSTA
jgi:hypothetical protein